LSGTRDLSYILGKNRGGTAIAFGGFEFTLTTLLNGGKKPSAVQEKGPKVRRGEQEDLQLLAGLQRNCVEFLHRKRQACFDDVRDKKNDSEIKKNYLQSSQFQIENGRAERRWW